MNTPLFHLSKDFYTLFEGLKGVLFFVKGEKGQILGGNKRFAEHCGFKVASEVIGKTDKDIFPIALAEQFIADDLQVMQSRHGKKDIIELFPNYLGDLAWFITNKIPLYNKSGQITALCGTCQPYQDSGLYIGPYNQIHHALEYLKEHYTQPVSNGQLAEISGLSIRQFEKRFRQVFNTTAQKYIMKLRILKSCELILSQDYAMAEISQQLGFFDQSAFSNHFKTVVGMSPLKYLKAHKN